jgi:hypothetical protein
MNWMRKDSLVIWWATFFIVLALFLFKIIFDMDSVLIFLIVVVVLSVSWIVKFKYIRNRKKV